jgi:phospholipid/cholesterol/gamma-HCH transport system substrate-binding protein
MLMKAPKRTGVGQKVMLRVYGVVFLLVMALLIGLSIATYQKAFVDVVHVTLETDKVGNQLAPPSDVKLRGLIVGEVRKVTSDGSTATVDLALDPDSVGLIPSNVSARLLPKTLFGEKYVDLVVPTEPAARPIRENDVIPQDRTAVAIELERVLADVLPLLRTIQPAKLNATLNALSTALEGRGDQLGDNLQLVNRYFTELNPSMETIQADISGLADFFSIYADAAPDLLQLLRNQAVTMTTFAQKENVYTGFLLGTTAFANTTRTVVAENENRIIQLGQVSRPTLSVLAKYSPEYPCLLASLRHANSNDVNSPGAIGGAFVKGYLNITLEVVPQRGEYKKGEEPAWGEKSGPNCRGLPQPPYSQENPDPSVHLRDGSTGPNGGAPPTAGRALPGILVDPASGHSGSAEEQQVVNALLAPSMGVQPDEVPDIATLLYGPMARGTVVMQP